MSLAERFWSKVNKTQTCWSWTGYVLPNGYGRMSLGGRTDGVGYAHRISYELHVGPIPDGLVIDHLCRNRACVNPAHLEAVDHRTNTLRGVSLPAVNALKTHCKRGHEFTPENTYVHHGRRQCKSCAAERCRSARTGAVSA